MNFSILPTRSWYHETVGWFETRQTRHPVRTSDVWHYRKYETGRNARLRHSILQPKKRTHTQKTNKQTKNKNKRDRERDQREGLLNGTYHNHCFPSPIIKIYLSLTKQWAINQLYIRISLHIQLTTTVSWCFPSNSKNSLTQTSKPRLVKFSNQAYMASLGFVVRVYLAVTNTEGCLSKLCNVLKSVSVHV